MSVAAYAKTNLTTETPTKTEYRLFAEITGELEQVNKQAEVSQARVNALFRNSQLWLTLEADLVSEQNKLDIELKAGLISLAIWVKKFTSSAMRTTIELEPLISVNRQIM
ncbi:MAG: flagellar biosynthesis regulator FlaF, partial [Sneathiella sp.]